MKKKGSPGDLALKGRIFQESGFNRMFFLACPKMSLNYGKRVKIY